MNNQISLNNVSFDFLKGSTEFLNLVMNNISSCVLMLDKHMQLQAFNESLTTIFSSRQNENLMYVRCGEAIGCAYNIEEMKECGKTSHCESCGLRESAMISYYQKIPVFKEKVAREFYMKDGKKTLKYLQFSTRSFYFNKDRYIIMIVDDISPLTQARDALKYKKQQINKLKKQIRIVS
ncbi:hypothetical protein [Sunxiuqinia elliptica]|uniref:PAS domain-containing protein n=1 Tax=Sunxiuqinia elliptica TaxID=655355 RepID=A0A4R6GSN1_9BACT|nr:hypothetical protein [Sunxiuqinia elliptica]TDN98286.1 hypothetical protein DET52_10873 [Sunxiuqinia elliptica]TDO60392.1 hypothetical protein DET65_2196 [Sunxiuqinia elliptica]